MSFAMMMMTAALFPAAAFHSAPLKSTMQQRRSMRCYKHRTPVLSHTKLQLSKYVEDAKSPLTDDDIESIANNNNNIIIGNSSDSIEVIINKQAGLFANINSERTLGILVLLTVPLAWGTYSPVVKYMYDKMNPSMPGFVFSAGYYIVAAISLGILSSMQDNKVVEEEEIDKLEVDKNGEMIQTDSYDNDESITTRGGLELGSYLFLGNGLQVVGLQSVPADRAAFLVQLTTVLVPLLSAISAGTLSAVPLLTWFACIIAFTGVIVMGADGSDNNVDTLSFGSIDMNQVISSLHISQGDFLIVLAAVAYTMHVVRLGEYAPLTTPLKLAASKATTEACLSILLVIILTVIGSTHFPSPEFVSQTASSISDYFTIITSAVMEGDIFSNQQKESSLGVSVGAILWTGWVTCAYTIYAQSFGQKRVNPTDSNLIYTTQPLFSSMFAYILLGETLGVFGYIGATLIGIALWLVSSTVEENNSSN